MMMRIRMLAAVLTVVVLISLPFLGLNDYWVRQTVLVAMLALVVSGLNLSFGFAGELALGQAAVYAAGAFAAGYVAKEHVNDLAAVMVLATIVAVLVGVVAGAPGIRLGGWMLAVSSFFLVLLLPDLVSIIGEPVGGAEGLIGIPIPQLFGRELDTRDFYVATIVVTAIWFGLFRNFIRSPRGAELRIIGSGQALSESLAVWTYGAKLKAYALAAVPAGMAGTLFAYLDGYVSTSSFGLHTTLVILAAGVLGGLRTVIGAVIGAALLQLGPTGSTAFDQYAEVVFGAFLLVGGVLLPRGLAPLASGLIGRLTRGRRTQVAREYDATRVRAALPAVPGADLAVVDLEKTFGGHQALAGVSMFAPKGQVTALIGPNGSGKTTLLNLVGGHYPSDAGSLRLGDTELTGLVGWRRARLGLGRTFQTPVMPVGLTVAEVVRSGMLADEVGVLASMVRWPTYWSRQRRAQVVVSHVLDALGLSGLAHEPADTLPLGSRRLVELGRAIAGGQGVLLLDEVASGLDADEVAELQQVIGRLREAGATIVLVEHNFDLVRAVSDQIVVLADGRVLAAGAPAVVAADPRVREIYLGSGPTAPTGAPVDAREEVRS